MAAVENDTILSSTRNVSQWLSLDNVSTHGIKSDDYVNTGITWNYQQIAYALIAVLGVVGNSVVIFVILHSVSMRNKFTNILLLNQSIIDLVTSVLIMTTKTLHISEDNLSGLGYEILCKFWLNEFPLWSLMISSSYSLMAITIERYMGIVHPFLHHTSFSKRRVLLMASAAWWPGPILMLCFLVSTSGIINGRCYSMAIFVSSTWKNVRGVVLFVVEYLLPITVFITCYSRMFIRLRKQVHPQATNIGNELSAQNVRVRRNILKTLLLVIIAYVLCNSFNQLTFLAFNFGAPLDFNGYYYDFTVIAMFANCCINPFVYVLQYRPYQNELRKVFCKRDAAVDVDLS